MADAQVRWIKENVARLDCAGGQITIENFEEFLNADIKTVQTTLTRKGILAAGNKQYWRKFLILIPGSGWADCWTPKD